MNAISSVEPDSYSPFLVDIAGNISFNAWSSPLSNRWDLHVLTLDDCLYRLKLWTGDFPKSLDPEWILITEYIVLRSAFSGDMDLTEDSFQGYRVIT